MNSSLRWAASGRTSATDAEIESVATMATDTVKTATSDALTGQYPYDTIVYILDQFGGSYWQGSGVLISPDEVLTASHIVWRTGVGVATNIEVAPGYQSGNAPYGFIAGTAAHYNPINDANDKISFFSSQSDYAIIHLSQAVPGLGTMKVGSDYAGGQLTESGYPENAYGAQVNFADTVTQDADYSLLDGTSIGPGSSGGPLWTNQNGTPTVFGLVSSYDLTTTSLGYDVQITAAKAAIIHNWVAADDAALAPPSLAVLDTTTNQTEQTQPVLYNGPVQGLAEQWIAINDDSVNVATGSPNWFIHTGAGTDAVALQSGTNVVDGGSGSNFLAGGTGHDTFFTDDRSASVAIWDTLVNFHAGDSATIFGVTQAATTLNWADNEGAGGYTGLTLHATTAGKAEASVTFAGISSAALTNGQFSISFGVTGNAPYMYVHANR